MVDTPARQAHQLQLLQGLSELPQRPSWHTDSNIQRPNFVFDHTLLVLDDMAFTISQQSRRWHSWLRWLSASGAAAGLSFDSTQVKAELDMLEDPGSALADHNRFLTAWNLPTTYYKGQNRMWLLWEGSQQGHRLSQLHPHT